MILKRLRIDNSIKRLTFLFLVVFLLLSPVTTYAFQVDPLPEDNLIQNPWFRRAGNPNDSGLDGWIDAGGNNKYWSSSQKASNPTPNQVIAGPCGSGEMYCGTSARLDPTKGQSGGIGIPGVDAYLYQVVEADPSDRKLVFFAHWVSHEIEVAEVTIYGGDSPDGPWDLVWVPLYHTQDKLIRPSRGGGVEELWENTGFVETVLEAGHSFYKVEIHARLPEGNATGFKITGVYFSTAQTDEPPSNSIYVTPLAANPPETSAVEVTSEPVETDIVEATGEPGEPTVVEGTVESGPRITQAARRTQMAQVSLVPTMTSTIVPASSPTPPAIILDTPSPVITEEPEILNSDRGFPSGFLAGALVILLIMGSLYLVRNVINKR